MKGGRILLMTLTLVSMEQIVGFASRRMGRCSHRTNSTKSLVLGMKWELQFSPGSLLGSMVLSLVDFGRTLQSTDIHYKSGFLLESVARQMMGMLENLHIPSNAHVL
jgi:hypothetical protein